MVDDEVESERRKGTSICTDVRRRHSSEESTRYRSLCGILWLVVLVESFQYVVAEKSLSHVIGVHDSRWSSRLSHVSTGRRLLDTRYKTSPFSHVSKDRKNNVSNALFGV